MGVKIRERPKGSGVWWIFIHQHGKRKAKRIGKDKALARDVAKRLNEKLIKGELHLSSPLFEEYATKWREITVPATCKPSTIKHYGDLLDQHVLPVFGGISVKGITRLSIKEFLQGKVKEYAPSSVKHMKSVISGVLNLAVDEAKLQANPAHRLGKITRDRNLNDDVNPLNREEVALFLKAVKDHYARHYAMALTLCRTGMRLGEVAALQWQDLDWEGCFIRVERSFSLKIVQRPKSGKSRRVDMSDQLHRVLKERFYVCQPQPRGWVFTNLCGNPVDTDKWRRKVFSPALQKAGLRHVRIHDLRHTFASLLIEAGESLAYIRDQLGHGSIKITVDTYGHLTPGGNREAVNGLDDPVEVKGSEAKDSGSDQANDQANDRAKPQPVRNLEEKQVEEMRVLH